MALMLAVGACGASAPPRLTDDSSDTAYCQTARTGSVRYYSNWVFTAPSHTPVRVVSATLPLSPNSPVTILKEVVQTRIGGTIGGGSYPGPAEARRLGIQPVGTAEVPAGYTVAVGFLMRLDRLGRAEARTLRIGYEADRSVYHQTLHLPFVLYGAGSDRAYLCTEADTQLTATS